MDPKLLQEFNRQLKLVQDELNNQIKKIQTRMISVKDKQTQINQLNINYNNYVNQLRIQFNRANEMLQAQNVRVSKKALLIGINYKGTANELYGCVNDVNSIKKYLEPKGFSIQTLTDTSATRANILDSFKQLLVNAKAGDQLFLSYSGHGTFIRDQNGDEKDGYDESLVTADMNVITDDELKTLLNQNLKKDVTLFAMFDSCHSGTILDLKYQYMDSLNHDADSINVKNLETQGKVCMISGCTDPQTSADAYIESRSQGAMTWCLLESLKQGGTWRTLIQNMRKMLTEGGYDQLPQFSAGSPMVIDTPVFI